MPVNPNEIENLIRSRIPDADIDIRDLRGDGQHFAVYIASSLFQGKNRIEQHQMVYEALKDTLEDGIQALAIQTAVRDG
jgi:stress-induced morphogen